MEKYDVEVDGNGTVRYYKPGTQIRRCQHRLNGPAVEQADGSKHWYVDGKRHRTDGPAVEGASGTKYWFIGGVKLTEKQFKEKTAPVAKEFICESVLIKRSQMERYDVEVDNTGTVRYYKPGTKKLHRLNGPAAEYANGTKYWYVDGKCHRTDGPAIEYADGSKCWYVDGKLHRLDGPAVEWADGTKYWHVDGKPHRLDGPAVEYADGTKCWYVDGNRHRTDGPAIEYADGTKYWSINGVKLTECQFKEKTAPVAKELTVAEIEKLLGHSVKVIG